MKAAVFDLDRTLADVHSARPWFEHERLRGRVTVGTVLTALASHGPGVLALEAVARRGYRGVDVGELEMQARAFTEAVVLPRLRPWAEAEIARHRAASRRVAVASAQLAPVVDPVAHRLGLERAASTLLESAQGAYTGRVKAHGYGEGKLAQVRSWAARHGFGLGEVVFYSDSVTDLPLLEAVGLPVVVVPDVKLRKIAEDRGWRIVADPDAHSIR